MIPTHIFQIDLESKGTLFQKQVWKTLSSIPSGETRTYGSLAKQLKTSPRALGQACRVNPILLVVPCHRVVATGGIGGFGGSMAGRSIEIKQWLLEHESAHY